MMVFVPEMPSQLDGVPGCFNDFEVFFSSFHFPSGYLEVPLEVRITD